jgi:hypothetical protein
MEIRSEYDAKADGGEVDAPAIVDPWKRPNITMQELAALKRELREAKEALKLIANPENYDIGGDWRREGDHPIVIAENALGIKTSLPKPPKNEVNP